MTKEIETLEDIVQMVDSFYSKVRSDDLLGPIFNEVIQDRWPEHLDKLHRFWETLLLRNQTYLGHPFIPHVNLPVDMEHFERWLTLFTRNINEQFHGELALEAIERASKMAAMFYSKINYYRTNTIIPIQ